MKYAKITHISKSLRNKILELLKSVEKVYNINILFAIESGSRLWRIESKDSDYDIRFVYTRSKKEYLSLDKYRDVIEYTKGDYDLVGFDIYKFLHLLEKSNPSVIEWLYSDIIYKDNKIKNKLKYLITYEFKPIALFYHYRSMCKRNYYDYLKSSKELTYKKYLYSMRGLINAKYVYMYEKIPPVKLEDTISKIDLPEDVEKKIREIIDIKKKGDEKDYISRLHLFEKYIEKFLDSEYRINSNNTYLRDELNNVLYNILGV
jgi:uncharacterized protein